MPRWFKIFFCFLAGLIVGEALPILWYILATNYFGMFDRDGGGAMGAIFLLGPISALVCGILAGIIVAKSTA